MESCQLLLLLAVFFQAIPECKAYFPSWAIGPVCSGTTMILVAVIIFVCRWHKRRMMIRAGVQPRCGMQGYPPPSNNGMQQQQGPGVQYPPPSNYDTQYGMQQQAVTDYGMQKDMANAAPPSYSVATDPYGKPPQPVNTFNHQPLSPGKLY